MKSTIEVIFLLKNTCSTELELVLQFLVHIECKPITTFKLDQFKYI